MPLPHTSDNTEIQRRAAVAFNERRGIRVGDVLLLHGEVRYAAYVWRHEGGTKVQPNAGGQFGIGSIYLDEGGDPSYSGALDPSIPASDFELVPDVQNERSFWHFDEGIAGAFRGVPFNLVVRTYRLKEP